jgi:hypothetical protein
MPERTPLYKIEMFVDEHLTKEPADADSPDVFTVTLHAFDKSFKVGLQDAKAQLKIKAFDDIIKHNLPKMNAFIVEIYPKPRTANIEKKESTPTTLADSKEAP